MSLLCRPAPPPADVQLPPPAARFVGHAPSTASAGRSPRRSRAQHDLRRPRAQGLPPAEHLTGPRASPRRPARRRPHASPAAHLRRPHASPHPGPPPPASCSAGRSPRRSTRRARRPDRSRAQLHRWATDPATGKPDPGAERPDPAAHAAVVASWSPSSPLSMASAPAICFEGEEGKEGMGCSPPPPSRGPAGLPASPSGGEVGRRGRRLPGEGVAARVALRGGRRGGCLPVPYWRTLMYKYMCQLIFLI